MICYLMVALFPEFPLVINIIGDPRLHGVRGEEVLRLIGIGLCASMFFSGLLLSIKSKRQPDPDLRRTCARLCHDAGGELDQIQFLLGHVSVQTTERYIGCKQRLRNAVNDAIGLEPEQDPQA
jgi:integrase